MPLIQNQLSALPTRRLCPCRAHPRNPCAARAADSPARCRRASAWSARTALPTSMPPTSRRRRHIGRTGHGNHGADITGEPRHQRRCDTEKRKPQGVGLGGLLVWGQTTVAIRIVNITHDNLVTLYQRLRNLTSTPTLKHFGRDVSCPVAHQTPFRRLPARIAKRYIRWSGPKCGPPGTVPLMR